MGHSSPLRFSWGWMASSTYAVHLTIPHQMAWQQRFVQAFKQVMKAGQSDEPSLSTWLSQFLLAYRSTPHATTNTTPGELSLQRKLRTRFNLLKPNLQSLVITKQATQKKHLTQRSRLRQFSAGQLVMTILKTKGYQKSFKANQDQFRMKLNLKMVRRHVDYLRDWSVSTNPSIAVDSQPEDSLKILSPLMTHLLSPHLLLQVSSHFVNSHFVNSRYSRMYSQKYSPLDVNVLVVTLCVTVTSRTFFTVWFV